MAKLTIIRGTPGSGKTTLAKEKFNCLHLEADMFFERDGKYQWNESDRGKNHKWCQDTCDHALSLGMDVVVTNTFTTRKEIKPYRDMAEKHGAEFAVITCKGRHKNTHDVPEDVLSNMDSRWEDWNGERIAKSEYLKSDTSDDILLPRDIGLVSRMVDSKFVKTANYCYWKHVRMFVENPEWDETGKLVISDYRGRPNELIEPNELMTNMTEKIHNLGRDDLGKFFITDLSGHERIDMITMSHMLTEV